MYKVWVSVGNSMRGRFCEGVCRSWDLPCCHGANHEPLPRQATAYAHPPPLRPPLHSSACLPSPLSLPKVCLGPKRPRQVITFDDRIRNTDDPTMPKLAIFEHIEGSRVSDGLFPAYQLPNGKQMYMYYNGGALLDEVCEHCMNIV